MLKAPDWRAWRTLMAVITSIMANEQLEQASIALLLTANLKFVEPNGAGMINITCRAELAAIATANVHCDAHSALENLTSFH
eukprot:scaffold243933_cov17-Tisochrysis_lutea.AAC.1